ncbi:hypothetical protein ACFQ40_00085 [Kroppenstedtia eburnea]|uniref:hypothetical protein n=1 Tax=Kroppenstedtia eburnea TaxID=714067 RepID=UPI0036458016
MSEEKPRIPIRISEGMLKRLIWAEEREGIDRSTLILNHLYQFVRDVESGNKPDLSDLPLAKEDRDKNKIIQARISPALKKRVDEALEKTGVTLSALTSSRLIKFILDAEARHNEEN